MRAYRVVGTRADNNYSRLAQPNKFVLQVSAIVCLFVCACVRSCVSRCTHALFYMHMCLGNFVCTFVSCIFVSACVKPAGVCFIYLFFCLFGLVVCCFFFFARLVA